MNNKLSVFKPPLRHLKVSHAVYSSLSDLSTHHRLSVYSGVHGVNYWLINDEPSLDSLVNYIYVHICKIRLYIHKSVYTNFRELFESDYTLCKKCIVTYEFRITTVPSVTLELYDAVSQ